MTTRIHGWSWKFAVILQRASSYTTPPVEKECAMPEQNKAVARRIVDDHWNGKDAGLASELFSATCSLHTPDGDLQGVDGALILYGAYATAFPDFNLSTDDIIAEGDKVVVRYTFTGTHEGPLAGIPASGNKANVQGTVIFKIVDGKADELRFVWNKFALLQQIGALPAAAQVTS